MEQNKTIREVYLDVLTELVKEESPTLYLEDFLYYYNKAISEYMKLRYEKFELTQQLTDDMRVWKRVINSSQLQIDTSSFAEVENRFVLPEILLECEKCEDTVCSTNCYYDCEQNIQHGSPPAYNACTKAASSYCDYCFNAGACDYMACMNERMNACWTTYVTECANKCMEDANNACTPTIVQKGTWEDYYRYSYRHLLSCVVTVELQRPIKGCDQAVGKNGTTKYKATRASSARGAGIVDNTYLIARFYRPYFSVIGNIITIDVGDIDPKWIKISNIEVEYLTNPQEVIMDESIVRETEDNSMVLEFPNDVGEEITKRALLLILERGTNPRVQTHMGVNQTINDPTLGGK